MYQCNNCANTSCRIINEHRKAAKTKGKYGKLLTQEQLKSNCKIHMQPEGYVEPLIYQVNIQVLHDLFKRFKLKLQEQDRYPGFIIMHDGS